MSNDTKIIGGIAILAVVIFGLIIAFAGKGSPVQPIDAKKIDSPSVVRDESHMTGAKEAKVTLVEFGDFQCPACAQAYPVLKEVKAAYPDLNFVFRHFPISTIHPNADSAAMAAEAAGEQGKFWEMHDKLYEKQTQWASNLNPVSKFKDYAQELGLDVGRFESKLTDSTLRDRVAQDKGDSNALGVSSTPTFFLNGQKLGGNPSFEEFKQLIEAELKK